MFEKKIIRAEKCFFLLLVVLHLLPVLFVPFFVTHDGPSHLYNSFLLSRILFHETNALDFFSLNPNLEPNWTGHFLMMILNELFSGNATERILIGLYIIALPLSFRKLILTVNHQAAWASCLVFPFIYSFLLHIGFYNFCIGIPVLFISLDYFIRNRNNLKWKQGFILSALLVLLYFSHIFLLVVFLMTVFVSIAGEIFSSNENPREIRNNLFLRRAVKIFFISLPVLFLSVKFVLKKASAAESAESRPFSELLEWLLTARPLITFKHEGEEPFAIIIAACTGIVFIGMIYLFLKRKPTASGNTWLVSSFIFLALYFLFPDQFATGGFISMRLLLIFYLLLFIWFATGELHRRLKIIAVAVFVSVSGYFLQYHYKALSVLSEEAEEYYSLSAHIKENAVVMPLDYSYNWMHNNLATYLGTSHNLIILDNYEAQQGHFPVLWKEASNPYKFMGAGYGGNPPCADINNFETASGKKIDYVTRWLFTPEATDSCTTAMNKMLENDFEKIFVSENGKAELFVRKNQ